ncbi:MAG: hypothetical protein U9O98_10925 [Asgard group archaeon]|nr:hypothetical protein [Asgard group archaeon]
MIIEILAYLSVGLFSISWVLTVSMDIYRKLFSKKKKERTKKQEVK